MRVTSVLLTKPPCYELNLYATRQARSQHACACLLSACKEARCMCCGCCSIAANMRVRASERVKGTTKACQSTN